MEMGRVTGAELPAAWETDLPAASAWLGVCEQARMPMILSEACKTALSGHTGSIPSSLPSWGYVTIQQGENWFV